jgi:hypothetical protein
LLQVLKTIVNGVFQNFVTNLVDEMVTKYAGILAQMTSISGDALNLEMTKNAVLYAQALALCILTLKVIFESLTMYILHINGESNNPFELLKGTILSVGMIMGAPKILELCFKSGEVIAKGVAELKGAQNPPQLNVITAGTDLESLAITTAIGIIIAIVFVIIIYVQSFIRSAELVLLQVMGCIFALSLTRDPGAFKMWSKEAIVISCSQALQIFMIKGAFYAFSNGARSTTIAYGVYLLIGWLWVTYKTPGWLKGYMYSSGVGKVAGGAAQSFAQMALFRRIMAGNAVK